jgi:hypothetical protein
MSLRATHVLAIVGAVIVVLATAISWYTRDVSFATDAAGVGYSSSKTYTLWDLTTLAPVLLVIAAGAGAGVVLFASSGSARPASAIAGLLGLGITAYCVVKCFDLPDFGPTGAVNSFLPVQGGSGIGVSANASTVLDAGPFVGILGGLFIVAGALGLPGQARAVSPGAHRRRPRRRQPDGSAGEPARLPLGASGLWYRRDQSFGGRAELMRAIGADRIGGELEHPAEDLRVIHGAGVDAQT